MGVLSQYRMALKGQQYLDTQVLDRIAAQYVTCDLQHAVFSKTTPLRAKEWASVRGVAFQHVRPEDITVVQEAFARLGYHHMLAQPVGSLLYLSREPVEHSDIPPHLPLLSAGRVVVAGFDRIPDWLTLKRHLEGCSLLLGTLGFDRFTATAHVAHKALPGLSHAWCLADVDSTRWVKQTPACSFGVHTHPKGQWRQMCYVPRSTVYADCRVVGAAGWLHCRVVDLPCEHEVLPLSMQLKHPQFQDYLSVHPTLAAQTETITGLLQCLRQPSVIELLRFIRKRNQDGVGQPTWAAVHTKGSTRDWDLVWALQLAERNDCGVVVFAPLGALLLHMARFVRRV